MSSPDAIGARSPPDPGAPASARIVLLLAGLAAGPAAWAAQLILDYGLASYACYPRYAPAQTSPPPGWSGEGSLLLAINLVCLVVALAGFVISFIQWRGARERGKTETLKGRGRSLFLAVCGVFASLGFAVAILFDTPMILGLPACWSIAT